MPDDGQQTRVADPMSYVSARRLTHINLFVADIDRSVDFYHRVLGLGIAWRRDTMRTAFLTNGNTHHDIGLIDLGGPLGEGDEPSLFHIALELENQVALVQGYERAKRDGFSFEATYDHEIAHSAYCRDPAGTLVELYADTSTDWKARIVSPSKPRLTPWYPGADEPSAERYYDPSPEFRYDPEALFHATKISKVVIAVANLVSTSEFYGKVCGLVPIAGSPTRGYLTLGGATRSHDITLIEDPLRTGFRHCAFECWSADNLAESLEASSRKGFETISVYDGPERLSAFIRDPDGFLIQLYADRVEVVPTPQDAKAPLAVHFF